MKELFGVENIEPLSTIAGRSMVEMESLELAEAGMEGGRELAPGNLSNQGTTA